MFIGHFGIALACKRLTPKVNVGVSMLAAQFLDVLWPVLVLAGFERFSIQPGVSAVNPLAFEHYPYSHSLLMAGAYGLGFALIAMLLSRSIFDSLVLGALVVSHWLLDYLVHIPDLPLGLGEGGKHGLGLWNSLPASMAIEALFLGAGSWLYYGATRAKSGAGRWVMPVLLALLIMIQLGSYFGPPPPSVHAVAGSALGMWLFFGLGYWADRGRVAVKGR